MTRFFRLITVLCGLGLSAPASAAFHLWQISELYSNADGSIQYIELVALSGGQQFLAGHSISSSPNTLPGGGSFNFQSNLPGDTAGKRMLIATSAFAALNVVTPDYVMPSDFFANGFLGMGGGTVNFAEGSDVVEHGPLPTDNRSIDRNGTPGTPTPTNFAGQTGTLDTVSTGMANLSVSHSSAPTQSSTGRDVVYRLAVVNPGPAAASNVTLTDVLPAGTTFIWAPPYCSHDSGTVTCPLGSMPVGSQPTVPIVVRPVAAGPITNTATVSATEPDPNSADNQSQSTHTVATSPAGVAVPRYRLYSDVTKEHHFTTDLNEYNTLGGFPDTWVQEGTVGNVLNNPGSFNGVEATPYYRLYHTASQWHHWTTDANEYYTLGLFPNWNQEGVDGWILPTNTTGATELYRLNYPHIPGLHHWTIDVNEYNTLINSFGWVGEPGAGFVVQ